MTLVERWLAALNASAGETTDGIADESAVRACHDLVTLYEESHRAYHNVRHLTEVLDIVDELADEAEDADAVRLAAWFHDAEYRAESVVSISSEEASARLAEQILPQLCAPAVLVAEVSRLVRLTEKHVAGDDDRNAAVLLDADLAILGADPERYADYARAVREEYREIPDAVFRPARARILAELLSAPTVYRTPSARARFESRARANVAGEIATLTS
ncbi:metal-dependent phosphohydrolase [Actinospica sp.]|uniref:HD domain-containing protein n=1 Tax=Actinospica sp. TaxID=1872142 RepID=UPI002D0966C8|nr:metal-dependent phosphohydrolase [Actinospica sp.]HWG28143.1 metal-dependent phosphohydrolase [Actinospica sp.]